MRLPRRIVVALALLLGAWLVAPAVIPLYDSAFGSDEPYRYVDPPPGYTKQKGPPTTATAAVTVPNGVSTAAFANSQEVAPQVSVYVPAGSLKAPPGTATITLTATPSAPKPPLPSDGTIVTNVYTITATAPGGPVTVAGTNDNQRPTLQMRAPTSKQPGPTFENLVGGKWKPAETIRVGQDVYQTFAPQLGVWALVQQKAGGGGLGGLQLVMLVVGIAILVVVGIIILVRFVRST